MLRLTIGNCNYSSWSMRPWLVLNHFDIEFELHRLPLDTPRFVAEIGDLSPTRCVPVLHDDGLTVWDSLAIIEYVADRFDIPVWPDDISLRASARAVSAEMHAGFGHLRHDLPMNLRGRGRPARLTAETRADISRVCEIWETCLEQSGGPFLFGAFCAADAIFAPVVGRFITYGIDAARSDYMHAVSTFGAYRTWADMAEQETERLPHTDAFLVSGEG